MNHRQIYAAAERLLDSAHALHQCVQTVLPEIEDVLRSPDDHPAGASNRQAVALSLLYKVAQPTQEFVLALDELLRALRGRPFFQADLLPPTPAFSSATGIDFKRLKKLSEPMVPEKTLEVFAPLRGQPDHVHLRLEALHPPQGSGYEVAIYRQETISLHPALSHAGSPTESPRTATVWVCYDTISSHCPTADLALSQVLGFLEMRCD